VGLFHEEAWIGLKHDLQRDAADTYFSSRLLRRTDAFDEQVGAARDPRQRSAEFAAGIVPTFAKQDCHLSIRLAAALVAFDTGQTSRPTKGLSCPQTTKSKISGDAAATA